MQQPPQPAAMNCSYDDLPPPPPPLSSSPSPPQGEASDSDNNSSVVTAAMPPVPQLRSSIRRNEYVNIPVTQKVIITVFKYILTQNESEHKSMVSQQYNSWYSIWILIHNS